MQGSVRRSDGAMERRWDRWSSAIGARAGSGWLGMIWAREKASREEAWLGVAWDSEKESRQLRERERAETENERSENSRGHGETHALFWKMVYEIFFRKPFSIFYILIFRSKQKIFR